MDRTLLYCCSPDTYADFRKQRWVRWHVALVFVSVIVACPPEADAGCVVESSTTGTEPGLVIHLSPDCTQAEREVRVVRGETVMEAIAKGHAVDLSGVIVRGDLIIDGLLGEARSKPQSPPQGANRTDQVDSNERQFVRAPLRIRDSVVSGAIRHRSAAGILLFEGAVDFQGSRFQEGVDLSRSAFDGAVELSTAIFEREAFFVQGQFAQSVDCRETKFGPSTRFHRSVFRGPVNCTGALFDGTAEFLEVTFEQPAVFERSRFGLGTGFSGSRFKNRISFDEAIFSRETFFTFTIFESEAVFAGARFLASADFSHAEFRQPDDLAKARFDQPPLLAQTTRLEPAQPAGLLQSRNGQYGLTLVFLIVAALLVAYAVKLK